jgi:hypothetical protein
VWAVLSQPVDVEIEQIRIAARESLIGEVERLIAAAVTDQNLPEQDARLAAMVVIGGVLDAMTNPAAAGRGENETRAAAQALTLMSLRGLGVVDARARGLVIHVAWPAENAA